MNFSLIVIIVMNNDNDNNNDNNHNNDNSFFHTVLAGSFFTILLRTTLFLCVPVRKAGQYFLIPFGTIETYEQYERLNLKYEKHEKTSVA